ncbi:hypothetical protein [Virgibacillus salexigens]|uniref:Uncharacterized protein n=1 Tax=Virgibacillus massiliensis TaxID=1462526 RepID=A0A024QC75_9BACI|nr:hypothetical protein [Virgibacillus massiliensis]CDQ39521.1 hypothetical protein BN990_01826 [Virgibacillus massiliensis]
MNKWLTTGEMIDQLTVREVAISQSGDEASWEGGELMFEPSTHKIMENNFSRRMNKVYQNENWKIRPRYVSFEEAMKALREGKEVRLHYREFDYYVVNKDLMHDMLIKLDIADASFNTMLTGKWTIENV